MVKKTEMVIGIGLALFIVGACTSPDESENTSSTDGTSIAAIKPDLEMVSTVEKTVSVSLQGKVRAKNRLDIFPEVQGKILPGERQFREGMKFHKGETILQLDDEEPRLQLYASRSGYQTLAASLLPDITLDYPDQREHYEYWYKSIHPETDLPEIPDFEHAQMERFLTSRGIYDRYYQIKSAEHRLTKFTIKAPFSGVLSATSAEPGQNVGPQSHLGTLIDSEHFYIISTVAQSLQQKIAPGMHVKFSDKNSSQSWDAVVSRINPSINSQTQRVEVYMDVEGDDIQEGMFLEGVLTLNETEIVAKIPRSALLRNGTVYVVRNGTIQNLPVRVTDIEYDNIWVSGLRDNERIVRDAGKALGGRNIEIEQE